MTPEADRRAVTLATIAAHLGVSRSTVSNAYNHPDQLSPVLRERILTTAKDLGYNGPDPVARRLRQGSAGAVGVLFSEPLQTALADDASTLFLEGLAAAGEKADSGMLLIPARPSQESATVVTNAIVDGFILYSIPPEHPFAEAALRRHLPVVCVDQTRIEGVSWVGIDDRAAAKEAASHLLSLGHRKVAIVVYGLGPEGHDGTWPDDPDFDHSGASVSWLRLEGYGDAFKEAGLPWADVTVRETTRNTQEAGVEAAEDLLAGEVAPTSILCTSDVLALGVLRAAEAKGIDVPGQLSVVGFNDLPAAKTAGLTTVRQPLVRKGTEAGRLLFDRDGEEASVLLDATLVVRDSTAKPSA